MNRLGILGVLLPALACAQVKLHGTASGLPEAQITYFHKLDAGGAKLASLTMAFKGASGKSVQVRTERTYAKDGSPIRVFQETVSVRPNFRNSVTVTFNSEGAHAVMDESGKRSVRDFPLAGTAPRKCLSEFWFLRDKPKAGQTEKYYHFDPSKLEWTIVQSQYVGTTQVKIGGKQVTGHLVRSDKGESVLDDQGYPLKVTYPTVTMVRVP